MAVIEVRVVPNARKSEVIELADGGFRVRLAAPAVEGAANDELVRVIAEHFKVRSRNVEIVSGHHSRQKRLSITERRHVQRSILNLRCV